MPANRMTPLEILTAAQDLIRDPAHWTQGVSARDRNGLRTSSTGSKAHCFCSVGALGRVDQNMGSDAYYEALKLLDQVAPSECIVHFNDSRTHEEVMAVWEKAKELARAATPISA